MTPPEDGVGPRRWLGRHPLPAFFALAFGGSWSVFGLLWLVLGGDRLAASRVWHVPFAWGVPLAALAVVRAREGGVRRWLSEVADPRTGVKWYVLAFVVAFLFSDTRALAAGLAGVPLELAQPPTEVLGSFATSLFLAGALEEFGWRGFAQARLQERWDALRAALVVGVAFGVWHLPWVLLGGAGYGEGGVGALAGLTVFTVLASVIFAWLFNGSGGAVPVVMLAHATVNAGGVLEPAGPLPGWLPDTQVGFFLWVALAIGLVAVHGRERLAPAAAPADAPAAPGPS